MDEKVVKYLIKKSNEKHPALIAAYIQLYVEYFLKLARQNSYNVNRNFIAEVPPELESFINDGKANQN